MSIHDLTVCLITCGEDTEEECLEAIKEGESLFQYKEVRNVIPQAAANNEMLGICQTKYIIPVDSDMILYPGWTNRILNQLEKSKSENWYQILFPLWDTLTMKKIQSLKILDGDIMRSNPYENVRVQDVLHYHKMNNAGYKHINLALGSELPIGRHVVKGARTCYLKYKDNYLGYRKHRNYYQFSLARKLKEDLDFLSSLHRLSGDPDYLHCISGIADGLISNVSGSKRYDEQPTLSFDEAQKVIDSFFKTLSP